jgi:hypothetical protein
LGSQHPASQPRLTKSRGQPNIGGHVEHQRACILSFERATF